MASHSSTNAALPEVSPVETTVREVNGVNLHVVAAGRPGDPLVVFLHGFPEFWYEWHDYVEPFVDAGYRVLVPDQRGYNRSDKPAGVRSYRIGELSGDVVDLVASEGRGSAHVVGHDWGGGVAWDIALRYPDTVDRLGIINAPHPTAFEQTLRSNPTQVARSWYVVLFQLPLLPEWYARRNEYAVLRSALRDGSRPETFTEADFERYRRAWAEDGALTAMINWYRALVRHRVSPPREEVRAPTLIIWGEHDQALVPELAPKSLAYCPAGRLEQFSDATHWIPHEYSERVSELLLEHFDR